jgi:hypothetical protein
MEWMAGYGVEPTLERLSNDKCERLFVADYCLTPSAAVGLHLSKSAQPQQ